MQDAEKTSPLSIIVQTSPSTDEFSKIPTRSQEKIAIGQLKFSNSLNAYINKGSVGIVYRAEYTGGSKGRAPVAVKVVKWNREACSRQDALIEAENVLRIMQWSDCWAFLTFFHAVYVEHGVDVKIVMPLYSGTLKTLLKEQNKVLSERQASGMFLNLAKALEFLKLKRCLHQDVKPDNILFRKRVKGKDDGFEDTELVLSDFSHSSFGSSYSPENDVFYGDGAEIYSAPEKLLKSGHSYASDVWSFGLLLYHTLTAAWPFRPKNISHLEYFYARGANGEFALKDRKLKIPFSLSGKVEKLLVELLKLEAEERIGIGDVVEHEFFQQRTFDQLDTSICASIRNLVAAKPKDKSVKQNLEKIAILLDQELYFSNAIQFALIPLLMNKFPILSEWNEPIEFEDKTAEFWESTASMRANATPEPSMNSRVKNSLTRLEVPIEMDQSGRVSPAPVNKGGDFPIAKELKLALALSLLKQLDLKCFPNQEKKKQESPDPFARDLRQDEAARRVRMILSTPCKEVLSDWVETIESNPGGGDSLLKAGLHRLLVYSFYTRNEVLRELSVEILANLLGIDALREEIWISRRKRDAVDSSKRKSSESERGKASKKTLKVEWKFSKYSVTKKRVSAEERKHAVVRALGDVDNEQIPMAIREFLID